MDRNNVRQILSQGAESAMTQKKPGKTSYVALPTIIYDRIRNRGSFWNIPYSANWNEEDQERENSK